MMFKMGKVYISSKMAICMRVIMLEENVRVKVFLLLLMAINIPDILQKEIRTAMESYVGKMVMYIMDIGRLTNKTV